MRRSGERRRGFTLLEALIALAVLAFAGIACVRVVQSAASTVGSVHHTDEEIARAGAFLEKVSLWTPADLDRHLGVRTQGDWRMYVERTDVESTYRVLITDSARRRALLETQLYRPMRGPAHAQ